MEEVETVTSSQLASVEEPANAASESLSVEEKFEVEPVSKGADSDTKAANAGIIDSSSDEEESFSQSAGAEKLTSSGSAADAIADSTDSVGSQPEVVQIAPLALPTSSLRGAESGPNGAGSSKNRARKKTEETSQADSGRSKADTVSSESQDLEVTKFIKAGASVVPDWCKRYFSDEIAKLNSELDELNEQVKVAQQKIRDVETRVALTRGIRNTLLTTTGDELVEACGKVLGLLGWKVTITTEDKHELRLEVEDKHVCIARVIWTTTKAERSHLGQLSISQTRYWMEKGVEPKGIIIVSK